jgi:hypothetical protein
MAKDYGSHFVIVIISNSMLLLSECSRLASRVEELEKGLREIRRELIHIGKKTQYTSSETGMTDQVRLKKIRAFAHRGSKLAEKLLAGAHAEEKE